MADDADLLWTTRNAFYVGAYAAAIAEAADLEGLSPAACVERDTYVMRCYVELGSYEVRRDGERGVGASMRAKCVVRRAASARPPLAPRHRHHVRLCDR